MTAGTRDLRRVLAVAASTPARGPAGALSNVVAVRCARCPNLVGACTCYDEWFKRAEDARG